jgi:predicted transcriptional regulator
VGIPELIAAEGTAAMAAYLATHGFENNEIADALGVGARTVSQYISDFRKGEQ